MFGMSYFIRIFVIQKATQKSLRRRSSQISTEAKVIKQYKDNESLQESNQHGDVRIP